MNLYKQTILTLLLLYFVNYVSCHKAPTAPNTGTLTGTVLLEGEQDHSGITVAFTPLDNWREIRVIQKIQYNNDMKGKDRYILSNGASKLAELDTTILRYNREYPNVGFPISQATEFEHRLGEVAAEAKTKQDGSFEIDGVEEGTYNLVAKKQGFGWKYIYPVR